MQKICPVCSSTVKGRSDKVYCSTNCQKVDYHDKIKKSNYLFYKIDRQIKLNRKLLKKHNRNGKTILRREVLHKLGFNPDYFTHFRKNSKGQIYYYCFEFGFLKLKEHNKDKYLIVNFIPKE